MSSLDALCNSTQLGNCLAHPDRRLEGLSEEGKKGVVCVCLEGMLTHMSEGVGTFLGGINDCIARGNQTLTG